jgi:hypothetical protein
VQVIIYGVIGLILFLALTTISTQQQIDASPAVAAARVQVDQYRMFMFMANEYMKTYSGGAGTVTWSALKTLPYAPSGTQNIAMPPDWKIMVDASNSWVACTPMDERAIGMIQQFTENRGVALNVTQIGNNSYIVVDTAGNTSKASQC